MNTRHFMFSVELLFHRLRFFPCLNVMIFKELILWDKIRHALNRASVPQFGRGYECWKEKTVEINVGFSQNARDVVRRPQKNLRREFF
jgi:hypothetical protein